MLQGELTDNSEKSWDVKTKEVHRYQVKCRVISERKLVGERQLSPFRTWDCKLGITLLGEIDFPARQEGFVRCNDWRLDLFASGG